MISIHGMRGGGKTTLDQLVFNDKCVQSHFNVKVWTHVSKDFDVEKLTKTIFESVIAQPIQSSEAKDIEILKLK